MMRLIVGLMIVHAFQRITGQTALVLLVAMREWRARPKTMFFVVDLFFAIRVIVLIVSLYLII